MESSFSNIKGPWGRTEKMGTWRCQKHTFTEKKKRDATGGKKRDDIE